MNPWAVRRKEIIFLIILAFLLVIIGLPTYFALQKKPSCTNGIKDGDETGVDCGGSCKLLCTPDTLPLITRGDARLLKIATSTYVTAVVIENPNVGGSLPRIPYLFTVYDSTGKTIKNLPGQTYVGRGSTFALFEGPFKLDGTGPFRIAFAWQKDFVWQKSTEAVPIISVNGINLVKEIDGTPRLEATMTNKSPNNVSNVEVVALLSDKNGNIIAAGQTFVDNLQSGVSVPVAFNWPSAFQNDPVAIRILPHPLPDKSFLQ